MDSDVASIIHGAMGRGAQRDSDLTGMGDRNATQGLTVIQNTLIQQAGGVADDAAIMAALSTASRVPVSGAINTGS